MKTSVARYFWLFLTSLSLLAAAAYASDEGGNSGIRGGGDEFSVFADCMARATADPTVAADQAVQRCSSRKIDSDCAEKLAIQGAPPSDIARLCQARLTEGR